MNGATASGERAERRLAAGQAIAPVYLADAAVEAMLAAAWAAGAEGEP